MKNIYKIGLLALGLFAASCNKEVLDTTPTNSVAIETAFENTKNAKLAVNGLAKMMTAQYESQGFNGEGTIKMYYGNYMGNHFYTNLSGWAAIINFPYIERNDLVYDYYPWYYYYKIIGNANTIVTKIDGAAGLEAERQFIKAQALTFRAYSFLMLSQLYCYRWQDSNNGLSNGLVLRLDQSKGAMPLSTLAETYAQIYSDLDQALGLYKQSNLDRKYNYEVNASVAEAIYARAAITRQDYAAAELHAANAIKGYPLMNNTDYGAGFANPTSEWIWSSFGSSQESLFFYSYFSYIAYNSTASAVKSTPRCISKELFEKIPNTDIRKSLFLNPSPNMYDSATGLASATLTTRAFKEHPDLATGAQIYAYMQFKVKANTLPGDGNLNHFRSSEMYLISAEAKYFQNRPAAEVQQVLIDLNKTSGRDAFYTCNKTGTALLNEIKTYRALELWGEGFDWFDMKRWNDPIVRKDAKVGGNFLIDLAVTIQTSDYNKWTWMIPRKETDYNTEIK